MVKKLQYFIVLVSLAAACLQHLQHIKKTGPAVLK